MVNYNAVGLNLSGIGGAIDDWADRRRLAEKEAKVEAEKARRAQLLGGYADTLLGENAISGGAGGGAPSRAQQLMAAAPQTPSFAGGSRSMNMPLDPDIVPTVVSEATKRGLDPKDVLTAMSYETGGTFNPRQKGPTTKWGQHEGLIQWGEPQRQQYGIGPNTSTRDQVVASFKYLEDRGVKPGMGLKDIYSAINAGSVGRYGARDAAAGGAPGTVADKVAYQMSGHRARAESLLSDYKAAPSVVAEGGTQQIQAASRADADMPAAGATPAGQQYRLPSGAGVVSGGSGQRSITPQVAQQLRAMIASGDPQLQQAALGEIQRLRATPKYEFKTGKDGTLWRTNEATGEAERIGADEAASGPRPLFAGNSMEAQALNRAVETGELTPQQATEWALGKTVLNPESGRMELLTPRAAYPRAAAAPAGGDPGPSGGAPIPSVGAGPTPSGSPGMIPLTGPRAVAPERPTEGQTAAATYATRMKAADEILGNPKLLPAMQSPVQHGMSNVPAVGNYLVAPEFRQASQAQRNFINASLRRESGAVISPSEFENARLQYFPQPGDDAATLRQKAANRLDAIAGVSAAAGGTALGNVEKARGDGAQSTSDGTVEIDGYKVRRRN